MTVQDSVFVVDADGTLVTAVMGGVSGKVSFRSDDPQLVRNAELAALAGESVNIVWGGEPVPASLDTPRGVLAALMLTAPGRVRVMEAPAEVLAEFQVDEEPGVIY